MRSVFSLGLPSWQSCLVLLLIGTVVAASGCKTQRRFGERKPMAQWYHNFTSHYNGYFNAQELIELAEQEAADSRQLDYTELLPLYPAFSVEDPAAMAPSLDKAMEKISLVVNIHRPSDYEDDSYLLLGKAQLLKQDYESAEHTFRFAVKDFAPENETDRLRRIEKQKIADGKAKAKANRQKTARRGQTRTRPAPRKRRSTAPRARSGSKKRKSSSSSSSSSSRSTSKTKKSSKSKSRKPKSRAEMAREQREARMAAEKEAEQAAEDQARAEAEAAEKAAEAEAERLAKLEAGEVPDADNALADGEGLEAPTNDAEKPKHGIFVHETALQDLNYWLARTYIAREKYVDAERILGQLARSGATFKHVRRQLPAAYAELYIEREKYPEAIPYLEDAIALSKSRKDRARYSYVLGQLHQREGDSKAAFAAFKRVIKLKPDFEMVFNAELNMATTSYKTGNADMASTLKTLTRMSKEDKYAEYQDQVYFKMAEIALEAGDREQGIAYLQKGLSTNLGNQSLAAKAYLKLGNLFFEDEEYVLASNYFDSTLQVLPKTAPNYSEIEAYRDNLRPVAANLEAIALQDSLLAIADMSEADQRKLAARIDQDRREAARAAAIKASREAAANPAPKTARRASVGQAQSSFFAYDEKLNRRAKKAFARKWGDRELQDNWRTLDSRESSSGTAAIDTEVASIIVNEEALNDILKDVPNDATSRAASNEIIENALISLGRQYRDKLENPARAVEALEDLLRRYPQSAFIDEALYLAALAYDELNRPADAKRMRSRLVNDYPDSKFAKSISDPEFYNTANSEQKRLTAYYDSTFELFENGQVDEALLRLDGVEAEFGTEYEMKPRFALLRAMVVGKKDGKEPYIGELRKVVANYASSEEATRAKEILRLLGERAGAAGALDKAAIAATAVETNFTLEPDKSHYFLAALPKGESMATAKAAVADYNSEYHRLDKLAIGNVYMMSEGEQTPVIVIRRFRNQEEGMNYFAGVSGKKAEFMKGTEFTPVLISQTNYREVLRSKSFAEYIAYFQQNYL